MKIFTQAKINWFDDGCCDVKYLDEWDKLPLSYHPGQPIDAGWQVDTYQTKLGRDPSGKMFRTASEKLMAYQFYPEDILQHVSDFGLNERWPQPGDRIVQRIHIFQWAGKPVADLIVMNQVESICDEPRRVGFRCVTVAAHIEQGEWSAYVTWDERNDVVLDVHAISRPHPEEPPRNHGFIRRRQLDAHRQGVAHFQRLVWDTLEGK